MYKAINRWTKESIIEALNKKMPAKGKSGVNTELGFSCRYRSPKGCCAVGALLSDDDYSTDFEGKSVESLLDHFEHIVDRLPLTKENLTDLQRRHDRWDEASSKFKSPREACVAWVEDNVED